MGTRAVSHVNLWSLGYGKDIYIATHWDGYPEDLGTRLKEAIETELKKHAEKFNNLLDLGAVLQKAIFKACADHHIDEISTYNIEEFLNRYNDFAIYFYDIQANKRGIAIYFAELKENGHIVEFRDAYKLGLLNKRKLLHKIEF